MLLRYFRREDIKIARGRVLGKPAPPWRSWCEDLKWPEVDVTPFKVAVGGRGSEEIVRTLQSQDGGLNPAYFAHIRKLSIDYWYDLDRKNIFDEFIEQVELERLESP